MPAAGGERQLGRPAFTRAGAMDLKAVLKKRVMRDASRTTNYGKVIWSVRFVWSIWSILFLWFAELDRPNRLEQLDRPDPRHTLRNVRVQHLTLIPHTSTGKR